MKKIILSLCVLFELLVFNVNAQTQNNKIELKYGSQYDGIRTDDDMNKWRTDRFGQFIHWGLYAVPGGVYEGKVYKGAAEWLASALKMSSKDWKNNFLPKFNPKNFDAKDWAKKAKALGVKYMTITTKHHEGFCLWPSEFTDYDVSSTPYKKDIIKQLVDAYNKEGIDVYFYYSILDWYHPGWRYKIKSEEDKVAFDNFKKFTENQLKELATNYPTVKGFWFDGTWDESVKFNTGWTYEIEMMLKEINPTIIVNSRLRADDLGNRHRDANGDLMGDYHSAYERNLPNPHTDLHIIKGDWECVMTVPENQWGYHKDWSVSHVKSTNEILEYLIHSVSMGGNFMLNFGPTGNGDFRSEETDLIKNVGAWLKINGEAIYNCGYANLDKMDWGFYTSNPKIENTYYLHVLNVPTEGAIYAKFPKKSNVKSIHYLENGKAMQFKKLSQTKDLLFRIELNKEDSNRKEPFVLVLKTE